MFLVMSLQGEKYLKYKQSSHVFKQLGIDILCYDKSARKKNCVDRINVII